MRTQNLRLPSKHSHLVGQVSVTDQSNDSFRVIGLYQTYARNEEIFCEGSRADRIFKVISGAVRTVQLMEDGRRQIGSFYLPGEVLGLAVRETHAFAAEAITDSAILVVRREPLSGLRHRAADLADVLLDLTVAELERAQDRFTTLGRRTAVERVASFLLDMSARLGTDNTVDLPMCRQDIGDFLGLTIETVSRTMTQLEKSGIIGLPSSRRVVLKDRRALMRLEG